MTLCMEGQQSALVAALLRRPPSRSPFTDVTLLRVLTSQHGYACGEQFPNLANAPGANVPVGCEVFRGAYLTRPDVFLSYASLV